MSDLEMETPAPDGSSASATELARNMISHDNNNAEDEAELKVLDEPVLTGDARPDQKLPAESLGNNQDPVNDVNSVSSTKANNVLSKFLSKSDIEVRLSIPMTSLRLIPIPDGQHSTTLAAIDSDGEQWNFKVSIRDSGRYPKPMLTGDWLQYVRAKGLKVGDRISIDVHKDEAGKDQYIVTAQRRIFNVFATLR